MLIAVSRTLPFLNATKKTNLTITSGVLTAIHIDKPSEIVAATKIPLDITKQMADIPKGILSVQVANSTSEATIAQQQLAVIKSGNKSYRGPASPKESAGSRKNAVKRLPGIVP